MSITPTASAIRPAGAAGSVIVRIAIPIDDIVGELSPRELWLLANPGTVGRLTFEVGLVGASGTHIAGGDWSTMTLSRDEAYALAAALAAYAKGGDPDHQDDAVTRRFTDSG